MHSDQCAVGIREESNTTDKRRNLFSNAERKKKEMWGGGGRSRKCLFICPRSTNVSHQQVLTTR